MRVFRLFAVATFILVIGAALRPASANAIVPSYGVNDPTAPFTVIDQNNAWSYESQQRGREKCAEELAQTLELHRAEWLGCLPGPSPTLAVVRLGDAVPSTWPEVRRDGRSALRLQLCDPTLPEAMSGANAASTQ